MIKLQLTSQSTKRSNQRIRSKKDEPIQRELGTSSIVGLIQILVTV